MELFEDPVIISFCFYSLESKRTKNDNESIFHHDGSSNNFILYYAKKCNERLTANTAIAAVVIFDILLQFIDC